jgi:hypothetical protein
VVKAGGACYHDRAMARPRQLPPRAPLVSALLVSAFLLAGFPAAADPGRQLLRFTFLGDIMGHDVNFLMADYRDIYRDLQDVFRADDLTVGNLEFPVEPTRPVSGYPFFNASRQYLQAAVDSGIDGFSLANNHAFDQGLEGVFQTLRSAEAARARAGRPLAFSGIRGNPRAPFAARTVRVRGLRVGLLAATQFLNDAAGAPWVHVVDYADPAAALRFRDLVRRESTRHDLLIVSYHGGSEYAPRASPALQEFFLRLVESGAHIVLGHHPHVAQGWRLVGPPGGARLVMESMGNFISGMTWRLSPSDPAPGMPPRGESYILRAEVLVTGGGVSVVRAEAVPIANYRNARGEMVVGKLRELADGTVPLPRQWSAYFAGRLAVLQPLLTAAPEAQPR